MIAVSLLFQNVFISMKGYQKSTSFYKASWNFDISSNPYVNKWKMKWINNSILLSKGVCCILLPNLLSMGISFIRVYALYAFQTKKRSFLYLQSSQGVQLICKWNSIVNGFSTFHLTPCFAGIHNILPHNVIIVAIIHLTNVAHLWPDYWHLPCILRIKAIFNHL